MKKKAGRQNKADGPAFPREEVDRLLVHGEVVEQADGTSRVQHPSYRELAKRYDVAHSLIARYSKQHNCMARRARAQQDVQTRADDKLVELRAEAVAFSVDDQVRTIELYLRKFTEAVIEGRVRTDNPSDYNTMSRLRLSLLDHKTSRDEVDNGMPTLAELQAQHKVLLELEGVEVEAVDEPPKSKDALH